MKKRSNFKIMTCLVGLVKPLAGYMVLAILMGVIGNLCASFITIFGGFAVVGSLGFNAPSIKLIFASVLIFAVVRGLLRYAEQACNHFIAFKLLALIRMKVFTALRKLCPAKLEGRDKGDLISVITSDIELLEVFYAHTISPICIATVFTVIMCVFIGSYNAYLALLALCAYITVGVIVPLIISKLSGDDGIKFRSKSGELSSFVLDSLHGVNEILQYGCGKNRLEEMNKRTSELSADEKHVKDTTGRNIAITNTVILIFDLLMLLTSYSLYKKGMIGADGVVVSTVALMSSFGPCVALSNLGSGLQYTFAAGDRVLDILEEEPVAEEISGKNEIAFSGAKTENVTFAYGEETILDNISLSVPQNSIVGIQGKSGSGKSTLLKLLMRFWIVQKGKIKISDTDINEINTKNLRDMESFVTQDTHLFRDSIKNNIRIAKLDASDEEIIEAGKKASVHDFIMSLPNGYDTDVGELGDTLSGGEKQRIGLARAFLHDADLILLDEPTSNLDSLNEAVILKALNEERSNKTVVLVSHRKSTMQIADMVYSVENGRMS
ncbi:MAG: ABC transporter ATP-binding protein/permease [Faecalibacterium sp.]|nr:ABC transporter ATP-binding protein/permease [Ruminococcus sp.]MCM1391154.1 ABC transporter ATP-binding protein/permease [Ruminococcus sp.]MCM1486572.1 ABC transporter ATP-binding protein/permease [Faecalibacterium sp.]